MLLHLKIIPLCFSFWCWFLWYCTIPDDSVICLTFDWFVKWISDLAICWLALILKWLRWLAKFGKSCWLLWVSNFCKYSFIHDLLGSASDERPSILDERYSYTLLIEPFILVFNSAIQLNHWINRHSGLPSIAHASPLCLSVIPRVFPRVLSFYNVLQLLWWVHWFS